MYIYKIEIENFRNFSSFSWKPNPRLNILFGPNGSGKTNLAKALSLVFSSNNFELYFDQSDYYQGNEKKQIKIRVWLDDISSLSIPISEYLQHIDQNDNFVQDDICEKSRAVLIYQLQSGVDRIKEWHFYQTTQQPLCKISDRKAIDFIHIDVNRQPIKEVGLQTRSTFFQISREVINPEIEKISEEIIQYANDKLTNSTVISEYLDTLKKLGQINIIDKYELLLKNPKSSLNTSGYELGTSVGKAKFSFERQSNGIQNLFLLLLMKKKLDGAGMVFVEELEQNLEPKHQRYIADEYKNLNIGQLFVTSHSPDVISHFDYTCIYSLFLQKTYCLTQKLCSDDLKHIHRLNKKDFISALMASKILLVEGDSEYESFPIYSNSYDTILSEHDIEIVRIGGKGNFKKYIEVFTKFHKKIFVLLDNDADSCKLIREVSKMVDIVFVAQNSYEDLILPYISDISDKLDELIEFSILKNKLIDLASYDYTNSKLTNNKKKEVSKYIAENSIDIDSINTYVDLCKYKQILSYILHDSFASAYYARSIASLIIEISGCPNFFKEMISKITEANNNQLETSENLSNIYQLDGLL